VRSIGIIVNADLEGMISEDSEGGELLKEAKENKLLNTFVTISNPLYNMMASVKINGEKVFCQGANWVPCLPFACGNIEKRQTEILELCAEAGLDVVEAVRMGSENPAALFSLNKGKMQVGYDADIIITDGDFNILKTIIGGEIRYES
jgi:hypothetical protein